MGGHTSDRDKVSQIRRDYNREELSETAVKDDPIEQFEVWFEYALSADLTDANAMTLSTATKDGVPSSRIVLVKGFDELGFRFYTNYKSRKAKELEENPHAALCFYWAPLERQVRIEGKVSRLSRDESVAYFKKRPRLSQLGAWASEQSSEVASRENLIAKFKEMEKRFEGQDVPTPDFWGGYILKPAKIEFWQGRKGRMHDRICYKKKAGSWTKSRLAP
jgi:pyridoxamine 5'-phosphate oxidase